MGKKRRRKVMRKDKMEQKIRIKNKELINKKKITKRKGLLVMRNKMIRWMVTRVKGKKEMSRD